LTAVFTGGWQVEVMELQWTQKENELEQERADVRKMATLFKQVFFSYSLIGGFKFDIYILIIRYIANSCSSFWESNRHRTTQGEW
jgi:hypothetical protein